MKTKYINDDTRDDATDRPVSLNNEATPDAAVLSRAAPAHTAGATSGAGVGAASGVGNYCNRRRTMRISNKRRTWNT